MQYVLRRYVGVFPVSEASMYPEDGRRGIKRIEVKQLFHNTVLVTFYRGSKNRFNKMCLEARDNVSTPNGFVNSGHVFRHDITTSTEDTLAGFGVLEYAQNDDDENTQSGFGGQKM